MTLTTTFENKYQYSPLLGLGRIRLLRLMPLGKTDHIQCQLFDYPIEETGERTCLYEALSYVWGGLDKPRSISIGGYDLPVTTNLYAALLHLRDQFIERILWVDAICIDQDNLIERAQQVQFMGTIYCKAHRVIVWLGEALADDDRALNAIRIAADEEITKFSTNETNQQAILDLIQRPWFQRIWVLQEVAAARHVLVMCGFTEIDGYAFCLGLLSLERSWPDLQNPIRPVIHLIRGSIFRPKYAASSLGVVSLDIRSLGELIDMYHTHKATDPRDKVFALLNMSSDDPRAAGLLPDYKASPEEIFQKLVRFVLGRQVSVKIWGNMEIAAIKSKGCILGRVSMKTGHGDRQKVEVTFKDTAGYVGQKKEWILQVSAKSIQVGDLVCFLQGASKPMIVRLCRDYFAVVIIAVTPLTNVGMESGSVSELEQPETVFLHDFLLVWDW
ncbi:HET-domain-containing protein, partial [Lepidopterella palustris CBS 459.81]